MKLDRFIVPPKKSIKLKDFPTDLTEPYQDKAEAQTKLENDIQKLSELQGKLYAQDTLALLIVLQGMDAAGKDSTVKHVMSGVNPTGCQVKSFKGPTPEELDHDYLWRHAKALPQRGMIGIFNRSQYEEVLVVRVHPELLAKEKLPADAAQGDDLWKQRFRQINHFERFLVENGIEVLKFFLHLSKEEQKRRFLARIDAEDKNWKFSDADVKERALWDDYQAAYEDALNHTSTEQAPWYVVPADHKWFTRALVADVIVQKLDSMKLTYPKLDDQRRAELAQARQMLESEK
jgi:PPK2 family polyphosphate:nucleotide phosphotransferase